MKRLSQSGFALFEAVIIVSVIAIVGLVGWNFYQKNQKANNSNSGQKTQTVQVIPNAPAISTVADLDKAAKTLDQTPLDDTSETASLDQELASF